MVDERGIAQIPVRLTPDQARIINAHRQLKSDLAGIELPKSGQWEKRETAIAVMEAIHSYLAATFDENWVEGEMTITQRSDQLAVFQDIITHITDGKTGRQDPRLTPAAAGGAAHHSHLIEFKRSALAFVSAVAEDIKAKGIKNYKAEARKKVATEFRRHGVKFQRSASSEPEEVTVTTLENWEKRK